MGTNKRYADRIDQRTEQRTWHPRQNVYPVAWECRNGQYADPYAIIQKIEIRDADGHRFQFEARSVAGEPIGTYYTGDEAAIQAWNWHLERNRRRPDPNPLEGHGVGVSRE